MKSVIIDNIHYINFITFFICPAEIRVRLIHPCELYAVKYSKYHIY